MIGRGPRPIGAASVSVGVENLMDAGDWQVVI
jgi:uridine phosphorylase